MRIILTILFIALTCEGIANILGILGFLVFAMTALILSCIAENKRKVGFKCHQYMSRTFARNYQRTH